ncbi:MAG: hypothetical protein COW65_09125, partial [Cytophagales bacterium CG18_big_fil_WC_8_21_14_2_50_42_9]
CFLYSCEKDNVNLDQTIGCEKLTTALVNNEDEKIEAIINQVLHSYEPHNPNIPDDKERLEALIKKLDLCPNIKVTDSCYACMESLPPQSGLNLEITFNGSVLNKYIYLKHDNENNLSFSIIY